MSSAMALKYYDVRVVGGVGFILTALLVPTKICRGPDGSDLCNDNKPSPLTGLTDLTYQFFYSPDVSSLIPSPIDEV